MITRPSHHWKISIKPRTLRTLTYSPSFWIMILSLQPRSDPFNFGILFRLSLRISTFVTKMTNCSQDTPSPSDFLSSLCWSTPTPISTFISLFQRMLKAMATINKKRNTWMTSWRTRSNNLHLSAKSSRERKNLIQQAIINNVQVYLNSASEMYIPYSLYAATLYSQHGIFEAMPPAELQQLMKQ